MVKVAILLAPVVEPYTMKSNLKLLAPAASQIGLPKDSNLLGFRNFFPTGHL